MKKRIFLLLIAQSFIIITLVLHCSRYYSDACRAYAQNGITGELLNTANKKITEYLSRNSIKYSEIANINYSSTGRITSITIDSVSLNTTASELSQIMFNSIEESKNEFGIPIGNVLGSKMLSGRGPKIKVRILPIGSVVYKIKSELISGGINQTIHRISVEFNIAISCLAPFNETPSNLKSEIVIAESVIVGEVPEVLLSPAR